MKEKREYIAVLENIRSLHNVGSIFRTAEGLGFSKVYLSGFTPAPVGGRQEEQIAKTALGAEKFVAWEKVRPTWRLLDKLKKDGWYLIALENKVKKTEDIRRSKIPKAKKKIALIVGHEVNGLSQSILNRCDKIVEIPMVGRKESFNVSVAFGIAGFWLFN